MFVFMEYLVNFLFLREMFNIKLMLLNLISGLAISMCPLGRTNRKKGERLCCYHNMV